jgi:hypothetical protein
MMQVGSGSLVHQHRLMEGVVGSRDVEDMGHSNPVNVASLAASGSPRATSARAWAARLGASRAHSAKASRS